MSPALQSTLLDELYALVPDNSQLWLATHSIGMMRRARDLSLNSPGSVAFLDFDGVNFDLPQRLTPVESNRPFWKRAMQIALDDLAGYVAPERVVLCEGGRANSGRDFDADCYNEIFQQEFPHVLFLGAGNAHDIQNDPRGVGRLLKRSRRYSGFRSIDRDDRTDAEIEALREQPIRVLSLRNIESYLLDDRVLVSLCELFEFAELSQQLLDAKTEALRNSVAAGGASDDLKRVAGDVYNTAKRLLSGQKLGATPGRLWLAIALADKTRNRRICCASTRRVWWLICVPRYISSALPL